MRVRRAASSSRSAARPVRVVRSARSASSEVRSPSASLPSPARASATDRLVTRSRTRASWATRASSASSRALRAAFSDAADGAPVSGTAFCGWSAEPQTGQQAPTARSRAISAAMPWSRASRISSQLSLRSWQWSTDAESSTRAVSSWVRSTTARSWAASRSARSAISRTSSSRRVAAARASSRRVVRPATSTGSTVSRAASRRSSTTRSASAASSAAIRAALATSSASRGSSARASARRSRASASAVARSRGVGSCRSVSPAAATEALRAASPARSRC